MRYGGNNFNYFLKNKLTKLAILVEFIRMFMFCLEDWGTWAPWAPLGYATAIQSSTVKKLCVGGSLYLFKRICDFFTILC